MIQLGMVLSATRLSKPMGDVRKAIQTTTACAVFFAATQGAGVNEMQSIGAFAIDKAEEAIGALADLSRKLGW